ncbi:MAG TPA: pyridoxal-phosphate dependent enzyme [Bacteroidales bacterium]|nr:pyridoxal-phosphate dependent enzyme [Bacteroidales bacterium]
MDNLNIPTLEDLLETKNRISAYTTRTPVHTSRKLNEVSKGELFFKCENFQRTGAFKFRGACNAIFQLGIEEIAKGVVTHSSGNHAQALALAAQYRKIPAYIVMPKTSAKAKIDAANSYGGITIFCKPTLEAREELMKYVKTRTGAVEVHPYNDYRVIAGQATAAMELIEDHSDLDIILVPVGGGGLASGTALAAHYFSPNTKVILVEPAMSNDAKQSFYKGNIVKAPAVHKTIADGLLTSLGDKTFDIIRKHAYSVVTVSEANILAAMKLLFERMKLVVEPSAAVSLGAILGKKINVQGKKVGVILSGGNISYDKLPLKLR